MQIAATNDDDSQQREQRGDHGVVEPESDASDTSAIVVRLEEKLLVMEEVLKRHAADFQNYRRRIEREREGLVVSGQALVVTRFLEVLDDLCRFIDTEREARLRGSEGDSVNESLWRGLELVQRKFQAEMALAGVEAIETLSMPFDESRHEAVMLQSAPEGVQPGVVIAEIQKGYRMGDRVLRYSKVIVSA